MKPVIWIIGAGVVLAGGYMWYSNQIIPDGLAPVSEIETEAEQQPETTAPADNVEGALDDAADTATVVIDGVVDNAGIVVQESTEAASEAASDAVTATTEAVSEAASAAATATTEAASAATEAVTNVVDDVATAASDAVTGTTEAASSVSSGTPSIAPDDLSNLLTVDGFDYDKVVTAIDASSLDTAQKLTLKTGLDQAQNNPAVLSGMLDQIKGAMGL